MLSTSLPQSQSKTPCTRSHSELHLADPCRPCGLATLSCRISIRWPRWSSSLAGQPRGSFGRRVDYETMRRMMLQSRRIEHCIWDAAYSV
jgi:hypothetical protein